jgi:type IV secretory pathway VirB10-like protein
MQIDKETTIMKLTGIVRMLLLISFLGGSALMYAQDQRDDAKSPQEPRDEATKPAGDEVKQPRQEDARPPKQDEAKPPKQDEVKPPREEGKPANQETPKQAERPEQSSRQAQQGGRIPDDKFRAHFGRQHTIVIKQPTIVEGQPRFQYSGYWFTIVDPWPAGWAYTDQCYIDYIDGEYFLFDLQHPGVRIALTVVL